MFRKSVHDYMFSKQDDNNIYAKYRRHKRKMLLSVSPEKAEEQQRQLDKMALSAIDKAMKELFPLVR